MKILNLDEIQKSLDIERAYELQKIGFRSFFEGKLIQPPVAHLELASGSLHIKFGMIQGDSQFVVKHATGFSDNWKQGLPTGDGFLAAFCAETGRLESLILDQGTLTDLRTALAVRLCAEIFAPKSITCVGVLGTGVQARLAAQQQALATGCRNILVFGRTSERVQVYQKEMESLGFTVNIAKDVNSLLHSCDVVITTTSSRKPILHYREGIRTQLLIAVGADETGKQELDAELINSAQRIVADSPEQCLRLGELQHGRFQLNEIIPLGSTIGQAQSPCDGLTLVDLTGLAVQDIQIVKSLIFT